MSTSELDIDQLTAQGVQLQATGNIDGAIALYRQVLEAQPAQPAVLYSMAAIYLNHGRTVEGLDFAKRCLAAASPSPLAWYIHGVALRAARRFDEALLNFDHALALNPNYVEALIEKGAIYFESQDQAQALAQFEKVLLIDPSHGVAASNKASLISALPAQAAAFTPEILRALALQNAGEIEAAKAVFLDALAADKQHFVALYSLTAISLNQGKIDEGLDYGQSCLSSNPTSAFAWYICGCALKAHRRFEEALKHLDRALELQGDYKEVFIEKGIIYGELKEYIQSVIQFNNVLGVDPVHKLALVNLATSLTIIKRHDEGSQFFARLLSIDPDHEYALGSMTHARLHCCNWTDFYANREALIEGVGKGKRSCRPLAFLAISDSPEDQLICSRVFTEQAYALRDEQFWTGEKYNHTKIRVGYVSPDLREHPVGHLMAGVFEHHDTEKFEIYSFSLGNDDGSSLRSRFVAASEKFIHVRGKSSREIAEIIRAEEIDVLVDLAGPTMDAQPDVFAYRPAPIQVGYLGYPGTSGASYIDYILADETVIPEANRKFYSEEVIPLPGCYLPTDSKLTIAKETPTRAEMNLPAEGFVFCSFNHDYKINPDNFGAWMRILLRVENSVMWLMKLNDSAEANLRKEAEARGVDPARLIFATRVPSVEAHLARYRLAGLFLDTYPYNAHTTASDAIRAGLPVVTVAGNSFQSRVATSIVNTIGMPGLSKATFQEYEDFAVEMASSPDKLKSLKAELQVKISSAPIFDTRLTTERIEAAFTLMKAKHDAR